VTFALDDQGVGVMEEAVQDGVLTGMSLFSG
jgi:hypothetical protein